MDPQGLTNAQIAHAFHHNEKRIAELEEQLRGNSGACAQCEEMARRIAELEAEAETFHMDYRVKCDIETKHLHVENTRLTEGWDEARKLLAEHIVALRRVLDLGHNLDFLFCGFKDKIVGEKS